jgi:hypothetical protein
MSEVARVIPRTVPSNSRVWRRLHDGNIIAEVVTNPGFGVWRASAYRVDAGKSEVAYIGRAFSLLTEAHQSADELVRREFSHECRTGTCGQWLRWRQQDDR